MFLDRITDSLPVGRSGIAAYGGGGRASLLGTSAAARARITRIVMEGGSAGRGANTPRVETAAEGMNPEPSEPPLTFAFGCSGWLFIWYLGVIKVLKQHGLHHNAYAVGSSVRGLVSSLTLIYTPKP